MKPPVLRALDRYAHPTPATPGSAKRMPADEDGQTIIELALGLPILCLMMFGFINFALVMYQLSNITFGAHAAARYASVHSAATLSPATTASVTSFLGPFLPTYPTNNVLVAVTYPATGTNTVGGTVEVVVRLTYTVRLPFYTLNNFVIKSTAMAAITV